MAMKYYPSLHVTTVRMRFYFNSNAEKVSCEEKRIGFKWTTRSFSWTNPLSFLPQAARSSNLDCALFEKSIINLSSTSQSVNCSQTWTGGSISFLTSLVSELRTSISECFELFRVNLIPLFLAVPAFLNISVRSMILAHLRHSTLAHSRYSTLKPWTFVQNFTEMPISYQTSHEHGI